MHSIVDSHAHINLPEPDKGGRELWAEYKRAGIQKLLIPGIHPAQWLSAQSICRQYDGIYFSVGLHPWWLEHAPKDIDAIAQTYLSDSRCVAIGECGLDKTLDTPFATQLHWFKSQLSFAQKQKLPLIIHSVKSHNEIIQQLKKMNLENGGVIHGFSGSYQTAQTYWNMGFYLGIGGTITYPRAIKTRETVCNMPLESLLLETDAPDMPLHGQQGQPNTPVHLTKVAQCLAGLRRETEAHIAATTTKNALALFKKMGY